MENKDGTEPDPLAVWLDTHQPKKGSKVDKASEATKKAIEEDLARLPLDSCTKEERAKIFKKHVGDNKYGYAKTYGLGVTVPRSRKKRCALEEERAKRLTSEKKVEKMEKKLNKVTSIMKTFLQIQGVEPDELSFSCSSTDDGAKGCCNEGGCNEGEDGRSSRVHSDESQSGNGDML